ncbi:MAG: hypothetical protein K8R36_25510 [Planctomycetales bacterium]|nr:hypothetical protein [Planctomycetales bacterium]
MQSICLLAGLLSDAPAPEPADVRKVIERSIPFLEKEGVAWLEIKKCATCHHVPMMIWTHHDARQRGFKVNEEAASKLETAAIGQYLRDPNLTPTGQDKGFFEKQLGAGTIYLSLALAANATPNEESKKALERFRANFVTMQNDDGAWTTKQNQPPLVDGHDVMSMLIVVASGQDQPAASRQKALQWLAQTPVREDTQALALRLLVAITCGQAKEKADRLEQLRSLQKEDGSWSQTKELPADALATGQILYSLAAAGASSDDEAVRRATAYLAKTQQADGSWLVHTRNKNGHDPIISYYGTGWATLGLLKSLPTGEPKTAP